MQGRRTPGARRAGRPVRAARRLRGRARQRRHDGVLGHRGVRPGARARPSTWSSASSPRSSPPSTQGRAVPRRPDASSAADPGTAPAAARRGRRRRLRPDPQRDLDRRRDADAPGRRAPTTARWCWSTRPPAPAACRSTSRETDVYYFAPQKSLRLRRRAVARADVAGRDRAGRARSQATGRWVPAFSDLQIAIDNSRLDQTYNTPALATLFLLAEQVDWFNAQGGLAWATERTADSSRPALHLGREVATYATPFVTDPAQRSPVVGTIDFDRLGRRRRRSRRCCAPTASSTPSPTASSAATSCASRCSRPSTRTTSRR